MSDPVGNSPRGPMSGNSHKSREAEAAKVPPEEREKVEKIIEGKVVTRKPSIFKRAARSMVADDVQNVGDFVVTDVLLPAIRNLVYDIISQGSHRVLFGTMRGRRNAGSSAGPVSSLKTAYHRVSNEPEVGRSISREGAARHNFDELILDSHAEAVEVLENLIARVERFNTASVADLYDLLGVTGDFPARYWGWTNLDSADVRQTRRGFLLDLPQPISLR